MKYILTAIIALVLSAVVFRECQHKQSTKEWRKRLHHRKVQLQLKDEQLHTQRQHQHEQREQWEQRVSASDHAAIQATEQYLTTLQQVETELAKQSVEQIEKEAQEVGFVPLLRAYKLLPSLEERLQKMADQLGVCREYNKVLKEQIAKEQILHDERSVQADNLLTTALKKPRKHSPWGLGISGGMGMSLHGPTTFVGVSISYSFLRW